MIKGGKKKRGTFKNLRGKAALPPGTKRECFTIYPEHSKIIDEFKKDWKAKNRSHALRLALEWMQEHAEKADQKQSVDSEHDPSED